MTFPSPLFYRFGAFSCAGCYQKVRSGGSALWAYLTASTASTHERYRSRNRAATDQYHSISQLTELKQTRRSSRLRSDCVLTNFKTFLESYSVILCGLTHWMTPLLHSGLIDLLWLGLCAVRWTFYKVKIAGFWWILLLGFQQLIYKRR